MLLRWLSRHRGYAELLPSNSPTHRVAVTGRHKTADAAAAGYQAVSWRPLKTEQSKLHMRGLHYVKHFEVPQPSGLGF